MYGLTNSYYGTSSPLLLNTSSSLLELQVGDTGPALRWTFTPFTTARGNGRYTICTVCNDTTYCLGIISTTDDCPYDCTTPHLASAGSGPGQQWALMDQGGGYQRLSNDYTRDGWYLDTYD